MCWMKKNVRCWRTLSRMENFAITTPRTRFSGCPTKKAPEVEFNVLTSTIDDIITQCGYAGSERERLTELHRRSARAFLNDYVGPVEGIVPLLGETLPTTAG